jgi:type IV pilus assembly protein PilV
MWRVRKSDTSADSGFSLLEVIIAMGILSAGLLAIATAQLSALKLSRQSRYLTHSMSLAQEQMERFQLAQTASLPADGTYNDPNNPLDPDALDSDVSTYNRRWTIARNTPTFGVTTVRIEVDWLDDIGNVRTTQLESMRGM